MSIHVLNPKDKVEKLYGGVTKVLRQNGDTEYFHDDVRHRNNYPAIIYADGGTEWWSNGLRHRLIYPAVILQDGTRMWYHYGKLHRTLHRPAVIFGNGKLEYWEDGTLINTYNPDDHKILELKINNGD